MHFYPRSLFEYEMTGFYAPAASSATSCSRVASGFQRVSQPLKRDHQDVLWLAVIRVACPQKSLLSGSSSIR